MKFSVVITKGFSYKPQTQFDRIASKVIAQTPAIVASHDVFEKLWRRGQREWMPLTIEWVKRKIAANWMPEIWTQTGETLNSLSSPTAITDHTEWRFIVKNSVATATLYWGRKAIKKYALSNNRVRPWLEVSIAKELFQKVLNAQAKRLAEVSLKGITAKSLRRLL